LPGQAGMQYVTSWQAVRHVHHSTNQVSSTLFLRVGSILYGFLPL
jgi:hypothetical protein